MGSSRNFFETPRLFFKYVQTRSFSFALFLSSSQNLWSNISSKHFEKLVNMKLSVQKLLYKTTLVNLENPQTFFLFRYTCSVNVQTWKLIFPSGKTKSKNQNRKTKIEKRKTKIEKRKAKIRSRLINSLTKSKNENRKSKIEKRKSKIEKRKSKFFSETPNQSISFARGSNTPDYNSRICNQKCSKLKLKIYFSQVHCLRFTFHNWNISGIRANFPPPSNDFFEKIRGGEVETKISHPKNTSKKSAPAAGFI